MTHLRENGDSKHTACFLEISPVLVAVDGNQVTNYVGKTDCPVCLEVAKINERKEVAEVKFEAFAAVYCAQQEQTIKGLYKILRGQKLTLKPDGWMLLECVMLDSSRHGGFVILPFGGKATYSEIPNRPISPRGLASDMSVVRAILRSKEI